MLSLSQQQQQQHRNGGQAAVDVRIQALLRQEQDYMGGLKDHQDGLVGVATLVAHDGSLCDLLEETKLIEFRETIKRLALQNVAHHRQVQAYLQGLRTLPNHVAASQQQQQQDEEEGDENNNPSVIDYPKVLKEAMSTSFAQMEEDNVRPEEDSWYLTVVNTLNEPKSGTRGQDGADEDEDDEIAVMRNGDSNGTTNLKCPITGMLMEEPMKNKVCGHVYEKHAILNHIRKDHSRRCPVPGCSSRGITPNQLVEDRTTLVLIRRQKIRDQKQREIQKQSQNAIEMDDSDDE